MVKLIIILLLGLNCTALQQLNREPNRTDRVKKPVKKYVVKTYSNTQIAKKIIRTARTFTNKALINDNVNDELGSMDFGMDFDALGMDSLRIKEPVKKSQRKHTTYNFVKKSNSTIIQAKLTMILLNINIRYKLTVLIRSSTGQDEYVGESLSFRTDDLAEFESQVTNLFQSYLK